MEEEPEEPDVIIQCYRGQNGYGIYFVINMTENTIVVTRLDKNSQAEQAGVQAGDKLLRVQDLDSPARWPPENPGREIIVTSQNVSATLDYVRAMKYCRMSFSSAKTAFN